MKRSLLYLSLIFTFLLGIHDGYVALWTDNREKPACVFPYQAASLPEKDRKALEQGIRIENTEQLHALLEDYLS